MISLSTWILCASSLSSATYHFFYSLRLSNTCLNCIVLVSDRTAYAECTPKYVQASLFETTAMIKLFFSLLSTCINHGNFHLGYLKEYERFLFLSSLWFAKTSTSSGLQQRKRHVNVAVVRVHDVHVHVQGRTCPCSSTKCTITIT